MRTSVPALIVLAILAGPGCGPAERTTPSRDAGGGGSADAGAGEGEAEAADAAPQVCFVPAIAAEVALEATQVSACAAWPSLDAMPGHAVIRRDGDVLTIDFEEGVVFTGPVAEAEGEPESVSLTHVHQHGWSDGCTWQATETLTGTIASDCSMSLRYDYGESVAVSDGACDSPCYASSDVTLQIDVVVD